MTKTKSGGGLLELASTLEHIARSLRDTVAQLGGGAPAPALKVSPARATRTARSSRSKAAMAEGTHACAIIGCSKPSRTKGYCAAHYQKLRSLVKTKRRPAEWVDNAKPGTVEDVVLPRGRAASKALAESRAHRGA